MSRKSKSKCTVNADWLGRKDASGRVVSTWAEKKGASIILCRCCKKMVSCEAKGFQAINQHVQTKIHVDAVRRFFEENQQRLTVGLPPSAAEHSSPSSASAAHLSLSSATAPAPAPKPSSPTTRESESTPSSSSAFSLHQGTVQLYCVKEKTVTAELLWVLKCVASNFSTASCDGVEDVFRKMFGEGVPDSFSLGRTKASYLITEALGPFFREEILSDATNAYYTVHFDETTNAGSSKELQVSFQYWSSRDEEVVFHHLETFFIGKADGTTLATQILTALSHADLPLSKMLTVSRDGPNVNKTVFRLLSEAVKADRGTGLLDLGSCNIHILHNAFSAGLQAFGVDVDLLAIYLYNFFDGWPSRWEEYEECRKKYNENLLNRNSSNNSTSQPAVNFVEKHRFIKHVSSRWLTLAEAAGRILEQWPVIEEYFLKVIPKSKEKKRLMEQVQYKAIVTALKDHTKQAEVAFVAESGKVFNRYCLLLQKSEPMIHVLYEEIESLTALIMRKAFKPETTICLESIENDQNRLPVSKVSIGKAEAILKKKKVSDLVLLQFRRNVQNHYAASASHLIKKSILTSKGVGKHLSCLKPEERGKERSEQSIVKIARALPQDVDEDILVDEWRILSLEQGVQSTGVDGEPLRIDHYWRQFLALKNPVGEPKYKQLSRVVKAALSLSHGSSDVERGFSSSGLILTPDKTSMRERTLNAKLNIKSGMKRYNGKPELVPVSKKLLRDARFAHSKYQEHLRSQREESEKCEKEKAEKEEDRRRREELLKKQDRAVQDLSKLEAELEQARKDQDLKRGAYEKLVEQANASLKRSIEKNDTEGIRTAQGMLEGANVLKDGVGESAKAVVTLETKIAKRKSSLLEGLLEKRPKI